MVLSDPLTGKPFASQLDAAKYVARLQGTTLKIVRKEEGKTASKVHASKRAIAFAGAGSCRQGGRLL